MLFCATDLRMHYLWRWKRWSGRFLLLAAVLVHVDLHFLVAKLLATIKLEGYVKAVDGRLKNFSSWI